MQFSIERNALQKELGLVQGIVERKSTIPILSNILIESVSANTIRIIATDLDVTIRCDTEAEEVTTPGAMCIQARKLFEIARLLPEAPVRFKKEENDWVTVECGSFKSRMPGVSRESFPDVPNVKAPEMQLPAGVMKVLIERTIFASTQEESRYTLSGAKFICDKSGVKMVATDGHRLAYVASKEAGGKQEQGEVDVLIPRKTLAELTKLTAEFEGELGVSTDENHIYFQLGPRALISRMLAGQFPNYEMVLPKGNERKALFDAAALNQAIRRVGLMADERSRAVRFQLAKNALAISSQSAELGEAREIVNTEYEGDDVEIGFNAQYLQEYLNVVGAGQISFEFKDAASQAELRPVSEENSEYRYVVMPMRL